MGGPLRCARHLTWRVRRRRTDRVQSARSAGAPRQGRPTQGRGPSRRREAGMPRCSSQKQSEAVRGCQKLPEAGRGAGTSSTCKSNLVSTTNGTKVLGESHIQYSVCVRAKNSMRRCSAAASRRMLGENGFRSSQKQSEAARGCQKLPERTGAFPKWESPHRIGSPHSDVYMLCLYAYGTIDDRMRNMCDLKPDVCTRRRSKERWRARPDAEVKAGRLCQQAEAGKACHHVAVEPERRVAHTHALRAGEGPKGSASDRLRETCVGAAQKRRQALWQQAEAGKACHHVAGGRCGLQDVAPHQGLHHQPCVPGRPAEWGKESGPWETMCLSRSTLGLSNWRSRRRREISTGAEGGGRHAKMQKKKRWQARHDAHMFSFFTNFFVILSINPYRFQLISCMHTVGTQA